MTAPTRYPGDYSDMWCCNPDADPEDWSVPETGGPSAANAVAAIQCRTLCDRKAFDWCGKQKQIRGTVQAGRIHPHSVKNKRVRVPSGQKSRGRVGPLAERMCLHLPCRTLFSPVNVRGRYCSPRCYESAKKARLRARRVVA